MENYYKILGIASNSDTSEIKKAYRKLALQFHPDKNKASNAHEVIVKITEAYEVLRNKESRKKYDILYEKIFANNKEITTEDIAIYKEWQHQGYKKAEEYEKKTYEDFSSLMDDIAFHTSNYMNIGCTGGIFIFLGAVWLIGPIFILGTSDSSEVVLPALLSFLMGIGALIFGNNKIKEMKEDYKRKKEVYNSKKK